MEALGDGGIGVVDAIDQFGAGPVTGSTTEHQAASDVPGVEQLLQQRQPLLD